MKPKIDIFEIAEKLVLFNNRTFTKKQWAIILKGCGAPTSPHFWKALKENNMIEDDKHLIMVDLNVEALNHIMTIYRTKTNESSKKSYHFKKLKEKARERVNNTKGHTFFIVNGVLTTERPIEE